MQTEEQKKEIKKTQAKEDNVYKSFDSFKYGQMKCLLFLVFYEPTPIH